MNTLRRRALLSAASALPLVRPGRALSQGASQGTPVRIGLLSDVTGTYQDNGGPGNKVAAEMAVADFGGTVLGRPVQVMQADTFNKPDIASNLARQWIDTEGVSLLLDGASSSAALAIQQVSREKKRIYCTTSSIATALVGRQCSPYGFQFNGNAWSLAKGIGGLLTQQGKDTWFFVTVDTEGGSSLQGSTEQFITLAGGRVLGSTRAAVGTSDFSSFLLQAKSSGAKVIGLANAGADLQNCIKQAAEFGIATGGQLLATLVMEANDVLALGQDTCKGLVVTTSFYWDQSAEARVWSERFAARTRKPPSSGQACAYAATLHWLRAVRATDTLDADVVTASMHRTPVSDFFNAEIPVMANGAVLHTTFLWQVKPSAEAAGRWDVFRRLGTLPSPAAFPPSPDTLGCPLQPA